MYFEALKIFCDVVRHKSFSRAAAVNHISQSAASQNVLQLEKGLGVRLIDRSKRPFQMTREGEVYYEGCKGLVERYYAVEEEVRTLRNEVSGTVSVAAIYSVGLSGMSQYVQRFARLYPQASVRLAYLHPDRVYESVLQEEVDIGLISYPKPRRELATLSWHVEPMVVACPPEHPFARKGSVVGRDLSGERFVAFDEALTIRREIDRQLRKQHVDVQVVMSFDNIETIKRAVELKEGVSILPEPTFRNEVRAGTLVAVPLTNPSLVRPLGIIHRRSGELSRTARQFIELIQQNGTMPSDNGDGHSLVRDSHLAPANAGIPSGESREGIPAKDGARKDSRTSGKKDRISSTQSAKSAQSADNNGNGHARKARVTV